MGMAREIAKGEVDGADESASGRSIRVRRPDRMQAVRIEEAEERRRVEGEVPAEEGRVGDEAAEGDAGGGGADEVGRGGNADEDLPEDVRGEDWGNPLGLHGFKEGNGQATATPSPSRLPPPARFVGTKGLRFWAALGSVSEWTEVGSWNSNSEQERMGRMAYGPSFGPLTRVYSITLIGSNLLLGFGLQ